MSNPDKHEKKKPTWQTIAHLFAFGFLLALAMMLVRGTPGDAGNERRVVFTEADVALGRGKIVKGSVVDDQGTPIEGAFVRIQNTWSGGWSY